MPGIAHVTVTPDADLSRVAALAGAADVNSRYYEAGILYVQGVSQQALDAALAEVGRAPFVPVPDLTPLQLRQGLLAAGMLADVEALVAAGPISLQLAYRHASVIERAHPMIAALAEQIGLSSEAVDELFRTAAQG